MMPLTRHTFQWFIFSLKVLSVYPDFRKLHIISSNVIVACAFLSSFVCRVHHTVSQCTLGGLRLFYIRTHLWTMSAMSWFTGCGYMHVLRGTAGHKFGCNYTQLVYLEDLTTVGGMWRKDHNVVLFPHLRILASVTCMLTAQSRSNIN